MKNTSTVALPPGRYILTRQSSTNPQVYILKQDTVLTTPHGGPNSARRVSAGAVVVLRPEDPWRLKVTDRDTLEALFILDMDDVAGYFPANLENRLLVEVIYPEWHTSPLKPVEPPESDLEPLPPPAPLPAEEKKKAKP